jgi:hypothetical protein
MIESIVNDVARVCAADNCRFDRDRFATAAGLNEIQEARRVA